MSLKSSFFYHGFLIGLILTLAENSFCESSWVILFEDTFSNDLSLWTGKNGGPHNGQIVVDPLNPENKVLNFTSLNVSGDVFPTTPIPKKNYSKVLLNFDYLGLAQPGSANGNIGGFIAVGCTGWTAGTDPRGLGYIGFDFTKTELIDDGLWHSYSLDVTARVQACELSFIPLTVEDWLESGGIAGDAYFDNIRLVATDVPRPKITIGSSSVLEGHSGKAALTFNIALSAATSEAVTIEYSTSDETATAGSDYESKMGLILIPAGQTNFVISISILGDLNVEPDEMFSFRLLKAVNAEIDIALAMGTILNDDSLKLPPIVTLTRPRNGDVFTLPAKLVIDADATDPDGRVERVEFFVNAALLGQDDTRPYTVNWEPAMPGRYVLTAVAFDDSGLSADTQPIHITVEDVPVSVRFTHPPTQTVYCPDSTITFEVEVAGQVPIKKVEFYAGTRLLSTDEGAPFEFSWEKAPFGDYEVIARAYTETRIITSAPVAISISERCGVVAIIRDELAPDIDHMQEYLFEMGLSSVLLQQSQVSVENLKRFQLVIWNDLGRSTLADSTVATLVDLQRLRDVLHPTGMPIYLIGERLVLDQTHASSVREKWIDLTRLQPTTGFQAAATVQIIDNGEAFNIVNGWFGHVMNFSYERPVMKANPTPESEVLARIDETACLVRHPRSDVVENIQPRSISQTFLVFGGGGIDSVLERKRLFQNAVCWLYRCPECTSASLAFSMEDEQTIDLGSTATVYVRIVNNGECEVTGARLRILVPEGLRWEGAEYAKGFNLVYDPASRTADLYFGRAQRGEAGAIEISFKTVASLVGRHQLRVQTVGNNARQREESIIIDAQPGLAPTIFIQSEKTNSIKMRVIGKTGQPYVLQRTSDLTFPVKWHDHERFTGPEWLSPSLDVASFQTPMTYFRVVPTSP